MMVVKNCTICQTKFSRKFENRRNPKFCGRICAGIGRRINDPDHKITVFNKKVVKNDGCWGWNGNKETKDGYSILYSSGKTFKAHRVSWMIHNGDIPIGLSVLHKCDNPPCTNPDHLFLGTSKDNYRDMMKKGRRVAARGEKASASKLKNEDVYKIRSLLKELVTHRQIAKQFNVNPTVVRDIKSKKSWKHLPD